MSYKWKKVKKTCSRGPISSVLSELGNMGGRQRAPSWNTGKVTLLCQMFSNT